MTSHIEFLKSRLETIKKRIVANPDYKEMKVLERMISELGGESTKVEDRTVWPEEVKPQRINIREQYSRDNENTPAPHAPHRRRISSTYQLIEDLVKQSKGEIKVSELEELLKLEGIGYKDNEKDKNRRVSVNYILVYNRSHPDDQTLMLWPEKKPNQLKAGRYEKVIYVGKERLAI